MSVSQVIGLQTSDFFIIQKNHQSASHEFNQCDSNITESLLAQQFGTVMAFRIL
jgi:hypothetical protein